MGPRLPRPDDLAATARAVGAAGRVLRVLDVYDYRPPAELDWEGTRKQALAIFERDGTARVPVEQQVAAAEALGQAGDPRLRRPLMERMLPVPERKGLLLGQYPVTVKEFEQFVTDAGYQQQDLWDDEGWKQRQTEGWKAPGKWEDQLRTPNRPVVSVSWYEARAFCRWLADVYEESFRLPTEDEWQAAATHPDGPYPWGRDDPTPELANYGDSQIGHATPVGVYPAGSGWGGHLDLAGNVWEWCQDEFEVPDEERVPPGWREDNWRALRGGGWDGSAGLLRSAGRDGWLARSRGDGIGFRVCLPPRAW